MIICVFVIVMS